MPRGFAGLAPGDVASPLSLTIQRAMLTVERQLRPTPQLDTILAELPPEQDFPAPPTTSSHDREKRDRQAIKGSSPPRNKALSVAAAQPMHPPVAPGSVQHPTEAPESGATEARPDGAQRW